VSRRTPPLVREPARREFITLLGGAAAAWPLTTGAQQPPIPVIGFLHSGSAEKIFRPDPVSGRRHAGSPSRGYTNLV